MTFDTLVIYCHILLTFSKSLMEHNITAAEFTIMLLFRVHALPGNVRAQQPEFAPKFA